MKNKFKYYKNSLNLNNKSVLITGGTGSFGNACVNKILECFKPKKLIIANPIIANNSPPILN